MLADWVWEWLKVGCFVLLFVLGAYLWLRRDETCLQDHYERQAMPGGKYRAPTTRVQWVCDAYIARN